MATVGEPRRQRPAPSPRCLGKEPPIRQARYGAGDAGVRFRGRRRRESRWHQAWIRRARWSCQRRSLAGLAAPVPVPGQQQPDGPFRERGKG